MPEMLPQRSHITRKRGVYYYRRRFPRPGRGEVAISLRTRHYRAAEFLAEGLTRHWVECGADLMTDQGKIASVLRSELDRLLASSREKIIATPYGKSVFVPGYDGPERQAHDVDIERCEWAIRQFSADLARRDLRGPEGRIRELMREHGIPEEDFQRFGLAWFRMYIEMVRQEKEWLTNGPFALDDVLAPRPAPDAKEARRETGAAPRQSEDVSSDQRPEAANEPLLSAVLPGFIELMVSTGEWTGQTEAQNSATYRMFVSVCGDRPVQSYTRRDCAAFFDVLRGLPSLYAKKPEWSSLSLRAVVEQTRGTEVDRLAMKTIKRHFSALGRLFDHLRKRGEYIRENPAHGFEFPAGRGRANDARQMWKGDKLKALFLSPVWTGCASAARRTTPGPRIIKDEKYWLPLLGLFHGNRLEEFAQLVRGDVRQEDEIWYFDINDDDAKQIKNAQSRRRVPLHPKIIALGFFDYLNEIAPNSEDRVFPQLKPGGPDGKLGYYFTKWFTRYRQDIGLHEKGLDYHSFRHGVTTKLFAMGVPKVVVDALTGHEGEGISVTVYLKELPIRTLYDAICKVEWPELD